MQRPIVSPPSSPVHPIQSNLSWSKTNHTTNPNPIQIMKLSCFFTLHSFCLNHIHSSLCLSNTFLYLYLSISLSLSSFVLNHYIFLGITRSLPTIIHFLTQPKTLLFLSPFHPDSGFGSFVSFSFITICVGNPILSNNYTLYHKPPLSVTSCSCYCLFSPNSTHALP